jgi:WD40 repeat protein
MSIVASILSIALAPCFGVGQDAAADLPQGAVGGFLRMPFDNRAHASEMSPDGKLLATLSLRSATIWDIATGKPLRRFFFDIPPRPSYQRGLAFSPDSKRLACGPSSELIIVWDVATGKEVRRFDTEFEMFAFSFLRFSADGGSLIVASNDVLSWFNVETGATSRRLSLGRIKQISPDDRTFAVVAESQKRVLIGDTSTGEIKHYLPIAAVFGEAERGVVFLPDGVSMAVVCHEGDLIKEIQFWDIVTGTRQKRTWAMTKVQGRQPYRLSLSPDGKVLYFPEENAVRRYSLSDDKETEPIRLNRDYRSGFFTHPDGKTLVGFKMGVLTRLDVNTGKENVIVQQVIDWLQTAISPDGRWLARRAYQYQGGLLELCNTESGQTKRIAWPWNNGATIAFASDSRALVVNQYGYLQFFSVPDLKEVKRLTPPNDSIGAASIACDPQGRYIATCDSTGHLRVFDLTTSTEQLAVKEIVRMLFTPDGKRILTLSRNSVLRLHEIATAKVLFEEAQPEDRGINRRRGRGAWVTAMALSPDGRACAMALSGGHVILLDLATCKERFRFLALETPPSYLSTEFDRFRHATALTFCGAGQWLAVGGDDGSIRLWDVSTRRELHRLHRHEETTESLAFSADGRRLTSYGSGEAFLWDLRPRPRGEKTADPFAELVAFDGPMVYRAIWAVADDPRGPAILREKVPPKRVDTRRERIAALIADLDSDAFKVRDAAMKSLAELEGNARPALLETRKRTPSLETARRIDSLLADLTPELTLRNARAVKAMELSGAPAARKLLEEWAAGSPGLHLTDAARAALARQGSNKARIP